jgi:hypothetical protein
MTKGLSEPVDEPKLTVVSCVHRHNPIEKSRLAFFINENGDPSIHREIASGLHKLAFAALLENEAKLLKAAAISECGLGVYSAA